MLKKWFILLLPLFRFLSLSFLPDGKKKGIGLGRRMGTFGLGSSLRKEKSRKQRLLSPLCSQIMLANLWRNMLAAKKIKKEFEKIQEKRLPKMLAMISYCTVKYSRRKKLYKLIYSNLSKNNPDRSMMHNLCFEKVLTSQALKTCFTFISPP